ncbi:hypothetical protein ACP4OV_022392 [Aristida adscensionis]
MAGAGISGAIVHFRASDRHFPLPAGVNRRRGKPTTPSIPFRASARHFPPLALTSSSAGNPSAAAPFPASARLYNPLLLHLEPSSAIPCAYKLLCWDCSREKGRASRSTCVRRLKEDGYGK